MSELNRNRKRTELVRGIVIEKMTKSSLHTWLAARLYRLLTGQLPQGIYIRKEEPLTLQDSEPEPDLAIVTGMEDDYMTRHPTTAKLVIEIAITNPALDRANAPLYAEAGIEEYWIILGREQRIEVYRQPINGEYQQKLLFSRDQTLGSSVVESITIDLSTLFAAPERAEG